MERSGFANKPDHRPPCATITFEIAAWIAMIALYAAMRKQRRGRHDKESL